MSYDLDLVNGMATVDLAASLIGAERAGKGWWCPAPGHDDRAGGKPSFSLAVKNGRVVGHCFACDFKGNTAQLIAQVRGITLAEAATALGEALGLPTGDRGGRPLARRPPPPRTLAPWPPAIEAPSDRLLTFGADLWRSCVPLTDPGRAWLRSRGIGPWAEAILRTATDETAAIAGLRSIAGWVAIPWVTPDRQMACVRFRRPWDGDGPGKLSPRTPEGNETCFPCPGLLRRPGAPEGGRLWLGEGESDSLTVLEHEPTATVWMLSTARGWRSSWVRLLPSRGQVVVALDEDKAGLGGVQKIVADLTRWIRSTDAEIKVYRPKMLPGEDLSEAVQRSVRERAAPRSSPSPSAPEADLWDSPAVHAERDLLLSRAIAAQRAAEAGCGPEPIPREVAIGTWSKLASDFDGAHAARDIAMMRAVIERAEKMGGVVA